MITILCLRLTDSLSLRAKQIHTYITYDIKDLIKSKYNDSEYIPAISHLDFL